MFILSYVSGELSTLCVLLKNSISLRLLLFVCFLLPADLEANHRQVVAEAVELHNTN
jgi:hypothetical protein